MNRKVLILGGAGMVAMVAIWYVALFSPQGSALSKANQRLDAARLKQTELRAQYHSLQLAKTASASLQAQIDALKLAAPDKPELASFIDATNAAADAAGVSFMTLAPTPPGGAAGATPAGAKAAAAPAGLSELRLSLSVSGTYFQVVDFMNRLNAIPRVVVIDTVNLAGDKAGKISAQLSARMFMQGAGSVAAPASLAATTTTTVGSK
jgi:Tfp pilus assembly protein PilO